MLDRGAPAPTVKLKDLAGVSHTLPTTHPTLIAFFKSSCPICQLTLPFLERLSRNGASVYGISQDDASTTTAFRERLGLTFRTLLDSAGYPVSNAYRITSVPSVFRLDPGGEITWIMEGFQKDQLLALDPSLFAPGENVPQWKAG